MMNTDPPDPLLVKLCEIQQLQLEKLGEISRQLAASAEAAKRSHEEYERQGEAYEKSLAAYHSTDQLLTKVVTWRAIIITVMLGLIAIAILIS